MTPEKLAHFRSILQNLLRQHTTNARESQVSAIDTSDDNVKDSMDMSMQDVNQEMALRLSERESQTVADIDQALMRMKEGIYGLCARCGRPIDERRLEAMPTARYDAECQRIIELSEGTNPVPTL